MLKILMGSNEFRFNEGTMKRIVQYYFENHLFNEEEVPDVVSVVPDTVNTATTIFRVLTRNPGDKP